MLKPAALAGTLRVLVVLALLAGVAVAAAQQVPWYAIPGRGYVSLPAYLRPADVEPDMVSLEALCADGGFMPLFRLGKPADPRHIDSIKVEVAHSHDHIRGTGLWHYDPLTSRAIPQGDLWSGFSIVMEWGGSLRLRVWFHPQDDQPSEYAFDLWPFPSQVEQVPCLRASAAQSRATWWAWDVNDESLVSGSDQLALAALFCPEDGPPLMGLGFREELDPGSDHLSVLIAHDDPDARFDFVRIAAGVYHGDDRAALRLLTHLVMDGETIGLQLTGGPRPFLVLEPANIVFLWQKLDCIRTAALEGL